MTRALRRRPFLPLLVAPAVLVAVAIVAALAAILRDSLHAYVPGSLDVGGLTLENVADLGRPFVLRAMRDTVAICFETALATLVLGYPVAYALVRSRAVLLRSFILVGAVTPLFLGEVVRTYSWTVVLGSGGFVNAVLRQAGLIDPRLHHAAKRGRHGCGLQRARDPRLFPRPACPRGGSRERSPTATSARGCGTASS